MYLKAIFLSLITIGITMYIVLKDYKKKGISLFKAIIGVTIALIFLSYPLYSEYKGITKFACTVLFAIQTLTLNEDFELLNNIAINGFIADLYVSLTYILYFIAPLLSATALLSLFENTFSKLLFLISYKKVYHIFSEINEKTVNLANRILLNQKNVKIIFVNKKNDEQNLEINKKFLKLKESINQLNIHSLKKEKYIYFMSNNEDENLNEGLEFISKVRENEQANIYILNDKQEAFMIIDSAMSNFYEKNNILKNKEITLKRYEAKLQVEVIDETERIVQQRLYNLPIQKIFNKKNKEINVLIVGCGTFGAKFLKSIVWCFQLIKYKLKIIVVEKNAEEKINKINLEAPELLKKYDIQFINDNIETVISKDMLKDVDINYAIVTAGIDTNNFNIAIALRRYFLINNKSDVTIDVLIRNDYKNKNIAILKNENNESYNINTFGSIKETYFNNPIINQEIEKMAKIVHTILWNSEDSLVEFYKSEYNRKSSRAFSIHIKYKLYSILQDKYTGNNKIDIENYKKLITQPKILRILAENEHDRWMAYMYADGYRTSSINDVEKYYLKIGKKYKYTLAKLHPALVKNQDLKKIEKELADVIEKLTGDRVEKDFTKLDYEIVRRLDEILS